METLKPSASSTLRPWQISRWASALDLVGRSALLTVLPPISSPFAARVLRLAMVMKPG